MDRVCQELSGNSHVVRKRSSLLLHHFPLRYIYLSGGCSSPPGDFRRGFNRNINPETIMPRRECNSPPLRRDLVKRLYFTAKDLSVPITVLNDLPVDDSLSLIFEASANNILLHRDTNQDTATAAV